MTRIWPAPAKLNLYLHVVGRRDDGYHLIDSLVVFADIADEIRVEAAPELSLSVDGPFAGPLQRRRKNNLVWRAALGLAERLHRAPAVALTLTKNLPITAGIGGGSSDAAAAIRALLDHWGASLDESALQAFALGLGADVPVCLAARAAWLGGIGETVEAAPTLPPVAVVLVNPGIPLPTPAVFARRDGPFSAPARFTAAPADAAELAQLIAARRNDLTDAALSLLPEIGTVLARLSATEGALIARMSGSGATCFALFATPAGAAAAAERLRAEEPHWWVAAGHVIR